MGGNMIRSGEIAAKRNAGDDLRVGADAILKVSG